MSSLLSELGSVPGAAGANGAAVEAIGTAFPYGDIDLSVHVDNPETLAVAQATIDNVVCGIKLVLDRQLFDGDGHAELKTLDLGDDYYSPFQKGDHAQCKANCCQILPVDADTIVRVDTPNIPGVDRRMRHTPLYVSRNTSIQAGFTLTRLLLCVASKTGGGRVVVPLIDVSLSVSKKRPCCPTMFHGRRTMAASAKAVVKHLEEMVVGESDPGKLEKRRKQLAAARQAREAFRLGGACRR
jgi:hypothetical protein